MTQQGTCTLWNICTLYNVVQWCVFIFLELIPSKGIEQFMVKEYIIASWVGRANIIVCNQISAHL